MSELKGERTADGITGTVFGPEGIDFPWRGPAEPAPEGSRRATLFITFGTQYGQPDEVERWGRDPHPTAPWATGNGWLAVEYTDHGTAEEKAADGRPLADARGRPLADARERARLAAWAWLGGRYASHYDEQPELEWYPRGEVARLVLP